MAFGKGRNGLRRLRHGWEKGGQHSPGLGKRQELQNGPGNDAQGSLGADKQCGQIIPHHILETFGADVDHLTRGQHHLQSHDIVAGDTVFDGPHASGVFRNIAADGGKGHAGRIRRVEQAVFFNGGLQIGGHHSGFNHGQEVVGVDVDDAVELAHDENQPIGRGHGPTSQAGSGPPRNQGYRVSIGDLHDFRNVAWGLGKQDCLRDNLDTGGVEGVSHTVFNARQVVAGSEQSGQGFVSVRIHACFSGRSGRTVAPWVSTPTFPSS